MSFESKLHSRLARFETQNHVRFSSQAKELISTTLSAITNDPSPHWKWDRVRLADYQAAVVNELEQHLKKMCSVVLHRPQEALESAGLGHFEEALEGLEESMISSLPVGLPFPGPPTITTFDVLHWLGRNLDKLCPIPKK